MGPVDLGDERPEWAREYAVGDTIAVRHPRTAAVVTAPVAGFSTLERNRGQPVIVTPPELTDLYDENVRTLAIPEKYHLTGGERYVGRSLTGDDLDTDGDTNGDDGDGGETGYAETTEE